MKDTITKNTIRRKPLTSLTRNRDWVPDFLNGLKNSGNVRVACQAANIERYTAYALRKRDKDFKKKWKEALNDACDLLEEVAWKRAKDNSDALLQFLLKANRPKKYRERYSVDHKHMRMEVLNIVTQHNLTREQVEADPILREAANRSDYFGVGEAES